SALYAASSASISSSVSCAARASRLISANSFASGCPATVFALTISLTSRPMLRRRVSSCSAAAASRVTSISTFHESSMLTSVPLLLTSVTFPLYDPEPTMVLLPGLALFLLATAAAFGLIMLLPPSGGDGQPHGAGAHGHDAHH